jgi:hypothetical protein
MRGLAEMAVAGHGLSANVAKLCLATLFGACHFVTDIGLDQARFAARTTPHDSLVMASAIRE